MIATYPNNDFGSEIIIEKLNKLKERYKKNKKFILKKSLGNYLFYSLLSLSSKNQIVMIGNSSAGIKECIRFKCPAINIGNRQQSRLKPFNVLNTKCNMLDIKKNITRAFEDKRFKRKLIKAKNPYYKKNTGKKIADLINELIPDKRILKKRHIF